MLTMRCCERESIYEEPWVLITDGCTVLTAETRKTIHKLCVMNTTYGWGTSLRSCTSAGLFHMDELVNEGHDIRILVLAQIGEKVEQCLLLVSWFGVTQLIGRAIVFQKTDKKRSAIQLFLVCYVVPSVSIHVKYISVSPVFHFMINSLMISDLLLRNAQNKLTLMYTIWGKRSLDTIGTIVNSKYPSEAWDNKFLELTERYKTGEATDIILLVFLFFTATTPEVRSRVYCVCVSVLYVDTSIHLAQVWYGEAKRLAIAGAGIQEVADEEDDLQQLGEGLAVPHLLARRRHRHHIWLEVVQLFLKL